MGADALSHGHSRINEGIANLRVTQDTEEDICC